MYVKSSYPGKIWVSLDDGQHTIGFVDFDGGSQWQRIWMPFWHDGSAKTIVIGSYNMPAGGTIYYGLWQINKGSTPGIYQYPGNATTEEVLLSEYRGSTAPAAGTYAVGDIVRSPTPSLSTGVGWICVSGGTPGTWLPLYPELRTTQAPTTGTYQLGDRAWSSNPAAGFPMGWVCVASGSPGTWRAMPNL
jgi:hypothetical protein